jgi:hypothetical protein
MFDYSIPNGPDKTIFDWCAEMRAQGVSVEDIHILNGFLEFTMMACRCLHLGNYRGARQFADFAFGGNKARW